MPQVDNSQRLILGLLLEHAGSSSRIRLAKELFLLSSQNFERRLAFTYDFFPYKFGPYSIEAFRDVSKLSERGFLFDSDPVELLSDRRQDSLQEVRELPLQIKHALTRIVGSNRNSSDREVIDFVYSKYPEYTVLSEHRREGIVRKKAPTAIYTVGYEETSLDGFLNMLIQRGIYQVIDVRFNPISRNWGFNQKYLADWCGRAKIGYIHRPKVGIPGDLRKNLRSVEDVNRLLITYERSILSEAAEELDSIAGMIERTPSVLMCQEKDPRRCHRGVLANTLRKRMGLSVIDLR